MYSVEVGLCFLRFAYDWCYHKVGFDGRRHRCTRHSGEQNIATEKRSVIFNLKLLRFMCSDLNVVMLCYCTLY